MLSVTCEMVKIWISGVTALYCMDMPGSCRYLKKPTISGYQGQYQGIEVRYWISQKLRLYIDLEFSRIYINKLSFDIVIIFKSVSLHFFYNFGQFGNKFLVLIHILYRLE